MRNALEIILEHKIVAILRGLPPDDVALVAGALYEGGINVIEVTLNSPKALTAISELAKHFSGKILVGAGTVLHKTEARAAIDAGAAFLISPVVDKNVIETAKKNNVVSIPGAFTPTEIYAAWKTGADIVKVFPSQSPDYIKNVLAPLNNILLMPTGAINIENIKAYHNSGAVAFGIGSALVNNKATINDTYLKELTAKAVQLIKAINQ